MKTRSKSIANIFACFTLLALLCSAIPTSSVQAESPASPLFANGDFVFAKRIGGVGYDQANNITVDSGGNLYITGYFDSTVDFDPGAGVSNLTPVGLEDSFIAKYDSSGNFIWAKSMGGFDYDGGDNIAVDSIGNVYTIGYFGDTVDFDPGPGVANLTSLGAYDVFISKLDSDGNFIWAKRVGGTGYDSGKGIVLDPNGNIYMTGSFNGTVDFNPNAGTFNLSSAGSYDIFALKLDGSGNFVWAKGMGGGSGDYGFDLALDSNNNVYITGNFNSTADFDPGAGTANLTSAGMQDIYVLKLNNLGTFIWAKRMGSISNDFGVGIALDSSGNVFTTGSFRDTADFDPGVGTVNVTPAGGYDIFVSKLDNNGNFGWVKTMGGTGSDDGNSIVIDSNDNIYTTGSFSLTADFDPGAGTANLNSVGLHDIFVSRLNSAGALVWAKSMGGIDIDVSAGIALDPSGNVYTTGYFTDVADFDPSAGSFNLTSAGVSDVFISKLENNIFTGTFADVPTTYWAWNYIERLYNSGVTGGCTTNPLNYCPDSTVTRAQMAVFLLKGIHGSSYSPPAVGGTTGFADVPTSY
ncbi:MAG: hypothetical protein C3F07_03580, partial [Anaerolineales bacterium]